MKHKPQELLTVSVQC